MVQWDTSLRVCPLSLLLLLQTAITPASAQSCKTYQVNTGNGTASFNNYIFYDWRNLQEEVSGTPLYTENMHFNNPVFGLSTSSYFNNTPWTDHWSTAANTVMNNVSQSQYVPLVYTALNVAIVSDTSSTSSSDTKLSLSTSRLNTYSAGAQINTNQKYMHASARVSARIVGPPGACAAFFLYGDDNNESDIEFLTNDTQPIFHATNHPSQDAKGNPIPGATSEVAIPKNGTATGATNGTMTDWNEYRIDWLPSRTDWYVNGDLTCTKTINIPKIPAWVGLNMWSNGGTWTGNMTINSTATLEIRWIEIAYNTTDDSTSTSGTCTGTTVKDNNGGFPGSGVTVIGAASSLTVMSRGMSLAATILVGGWAIWFAFV